MKYVCTSNSNTHVYVCMHIEGEHCWKVELSMLAAAPLPLASTITKTLIRVPSAAMNVERNECHKSTANVCAYLDALPIAFYVLCSL